MLLTSSELRRNRLVRHSRNIAVENTLLRLAFAHTRTMVNSNKMVDGKVYTAVELLLLKRDGGEFSSDQIEQLVKDISDGTMEDAQIGAMLMALFLNGISKKETTSLTKAMMNSGTKLSWPSSWIVGDKHSTGGVGDKVSIVIAPSLASCGLKVPMISGRGLGFTGGTLDKLESIPGFCVGLSEDEITDALEKVGCCIVSQTATLVPADRKIYSLRDVTATVGSQSLIVSSIISKKACESLHGLVLDVKFGSGSYQETFEDAEKMASALVSTAEALNVRCTALISSMEAPLGMAIGNALEIKEALHCLRGGGPKDLRELVINLGAELLNNTGLASNIDEGKMLMQESLDDGTALKTFQEMLRNQGVSEEVAECLCGAQPDETCLPKAKMVTTFDSETSGYIKEINALSIANFCVGLGAGREKSSDSIKFGVGALLLKSVGDSVEKGEGWIEVHHDVPLSSDLEDLIKSSLKSGPKVDPSPLIVKRVSIN